MSDWIPVHGVRKLRLGVSRRFQRRWCAVLVPLQVKIICSLQVRWAGTRRLEV